MLLQSGLPVTADTPIEEVMTSGITLREYIDGHMETLRAETRELKGEVEQLRRDLGEARERGGDVVSREARDARAARDELVRRIGALEAEMKVRPTYNQLLGGALALGLAIIAFVEFVLGR